MLYPESLRAHKLNGSVSPRWKCQQVDKRLPWLQSREPSIIHGLHVLIIEVDSFETDLSNQECVMSLVIYILKLQNTSKNLGTFFRLIVRKFYEKGELLIQMQNCVFIANHTQVMKGKFCEMRISNGQ